MKEDFFLLIIGPVWKVRCEPKVKTNNEWNKTSEMCILSEVFSWKCHENNIQWVHPFHETNAMENTSMPDSHMESRTELQIPSESGAQVWT